MRIASIIVLAAVAAAGAASAEDRYGPTPVGPSADSSAAPVAAPEPYRGRFLNWSGKAAAPTAAPTPAPMQPASRIVYSAPPITARTAERQVAPSAERYPPAARDYSRPISQPATAEPVQRAAPSIGEPAVVSVARASRPQPYIQRAPQSIIQPVSQPVAPQRDVRPTPMVVATGPASGLAAAPVRARFYSLHREYGDTPDQIGVPKSRPPVLIGPSDTSVADSPSDTEQKAAKTHSSDIAGAF